MNTKRTYPCEFPIDEAQRLQGGGDGAKSVVGDHLEMGLRELQVANVQLTTGKYVGCQNCHGPIKVKHRQRLNGRRNHLKCCPQGKGGRSGTIQN